MTTRSLRSTDALRLSLPWTRTETAKRAFCVAAPNVWTGTHYRTTFVSPVRCQRSMPNWKHFLLLYTRGEHAHLRATVLTFSWHYNRRDTNLFTLRYKLWNWTAPVQTRQLRVPVIRNCHVMTMKMTWHWQRTHYKYKGGKLKLKNYTFLNFHLYI